MKKVFPIILSFLLFFTGCESLNLNKKPIVTDEVEIETEPEPQPFPVIINDVEITEAPKKIVSLSPSLTEIICELGFEKNIIGRSRYCDFPAAIQSVEEVGSGTNPDIKKIISMKPNIVIASAAIPTKDIFAMENENIKTLVIKPPNSVDELKNIYIVLSIMMNGMFTGKSIGEQMFSPIESYFETSKDFKIGKFIYVTENLNVATPDTLESSVFSYFGTNAVNEGQNYSFSIKKLLENEPDVIFLNKNCSIEALKNQETYSKLKTVAEERIILVDNTIFERPSSRIIPVIRQAVSNAS